MKKSKSPGLFCSDLFRHLRLRVQVNSVVVVERVCTPWKKNRKSRTRKRLCLAASISLSLARHEETSARHEPGVCC